MSSITYLSICVLAFIMLTALFILVRAARTPTPTPQPRLGWMPWHRLLAYGFVPCAVGIAVLFLALVSPRWHNGPLGELQIGRDGQTAIKLPGDTIACPEQTYQERSGALPMISLRCETQIEGRPLSISVSHRAIDSLIQICTATYAGRAIPCESRLETFHYARKLPVVSLDSDLGILPARRQALRWQHPLLYYSDIGGLVLIYGLLIAALEICFVWYSWGTLRKTATRKARQVFVWWASTVAGGSLLWISVHFIFLISLFIFGFDD